jgi:hypothetical protein
VGFSPIKIRPNLCPSLATGGADEARLNIGKPDIIGPAVCTQGDGMAAAVVGAVDQDAAHADLAHVAEGDFLGSRCEHYFDFAFSPISTFSLLGRAADGIPASSRR